ncbi:MAG TPA: type II secretion system F family protein [Clostridia bacterium]|nr:type II secretion system F family protein [Clostridia bacterium]
MPVFSYEVVDAQGRSTTGKLEGETEAAVVARLRGMGYMVTRVQQVRGPVVSLGAWRAERKVSLGDLSLFSRQLASMLNAGIPLTRCLFALSEQSSVPALKRALSEIAANVEAGMSFTEALEGYPKIFSKLFVGMVRAGEVGGTLEESLSHLSEQLQKDKILRDSIRSATFYPAMVGIFSVLVMLVMMIFIVPIFVKMFPEGVALPAPTLVVLAVSDSLRNKWYLWIIMAALSVLLFRLAVTHPRGELFWAKLRFRIPVFGPLIHKATIARFARTLSTLLNGGIPVLQALDAAGEATGNILITNAVSDAKEKIEEGRSLAQPLEESGLFPPMVIQMVAVGEESGSLVMLLRRIADFFEEEVSIMTKGLTAMIEPLLLVFVGLTVGGMVIALYLPIFTAVTQTGM